MIQMIFKRLANIYVLMILTIAYLVGIIALRWSTIERVVDGKTEKVLGLYDFIRTTDLNAVGDLLAGIFAPIGFLWLVAAVIIQRVELTDAREQFSKNQEIIDKQLETVKFQNEAAKEQSLRNYKLDLFEHRYKLYEEIKFVSNKIDTFKNNSLNHDSMRKQIDDVSKRSMFLFGSDVTAWLESISDCLNDIDEKYNKLNMIEEGIYYDVYDDGDPDVYVENEEDLYVSISLKNDDLKSLIAPEAIYDILKNYMVVDYNPESTPKQSDIRDCGATNRDDSTK